MSLYVRAVSSAVKLFISKNVCYLVAVFRGHMWNKEHTLIGSISESLSSFSSSTFHGMNPHGLNTKYTPEKKTDSHSTAADLP